MNLVRGRSGVPKSLPCKITCVRSSPHRRRYRPTIAHSETSAIFDRTSLAGSMIKQSRDSPQVRSNGSGASASPDAARMRRTQPMKSPEAPATNQAVEGLWVVCINFHTVGVHGLPAQVSVADAVANPKCRLLLSIAEGGSSRRSRSGIGRHDRHYEAPRPDRWIEYRSILPAVDCNMLPPGSGEEAARQTDLRPDLGHQTLASAGRGIDSRDCAALEAVVQYDPEIPGGRGGRTKYRRRKRPSKLDGFAAKRTKSTDFSCCLCDTASYR